MNYIPPCSDGFGPSLAEFPGKEKCKGADTSGAPVSLLRVMADEVLLTGELGALFGMVSNESKNETCSWDNVMQQSGKVRNTCGGKKTKKNREHDLPVCFHSQWWVMCDHQASSSNSIKTFCLQHSMSTIDSKAMATVSYGILFYIWGLFSLLTLNMIINLEKKNISYALLYNRSCLVVA